MWCLEIREKRNEAYVYPVIKDVLYFNNLPSRDALLTCNIPCELDKDYTRVNDTYYKYNDTNLMVSLYFIKPVDDLPEDKEENYYVCSLYKDKITSGELTNKFNSIDDAINSVRPYISSDTNNRYIVFKIVAESENVPSRIWHKH